MDTLTVKIPTRLQAELEQASRREQLPKSELVRRALDTYLSRPARSAAAPLSALDLAGDLAGCFGGGPKDLASNPRHLEGFGR
jgi:hypothetical protein